VSAAPSIALARMALNLAGIRVWKIAENFAHGAAPLSREEALSFQAPSVSAEYYEIIDRMARGEKP
jgi:hypothetical protein